MKKTLNWLKTSVVGVAIVLPPGVGARKIGSVAWTSEECYLGVRCGSVIVPKDYFDPAAGSASIAIAVFKATKLFPRKERCSGGPGGCGTILARQWVADIIGPEWDLLGFDPRGINHTSPRVKCFNSAKDFSFFTTNTVLEQGFTNNPDSSSQRKSTPLCAKNMGDGRRYMATTTVVRDVDFMAKLFDSEDAKINYWGGSYGSILGAYLVNMHTYRFFLETCLQAGPTACPLAKEEDEPYQSIEERIELFFDKLAVAPLPVPFAFRSAFLTSGAALTSLTNPVIVPRIPPRVVVRRNCLAMDPITPISSGLRLNSLMRNSTRLIIRDGPGHSSNVLPTAYTRKLVLEYFEGKLPENGTVCDTSFGYFADPSKDTGETAGAAVPRLLYSDFN
ncbi:hypothetical protein C8J57DRAFT_1712315 [Mycena rebaudengoi]|nr:hypothetical protein C8J57DRAFT_1712315 [Mycena rebaudengoi]